MEDKIRHSKRLKRKKKERVRSVIAKELIVSGKYQQRIVRDKRGREHDLEGLTHAQLIKLIQEDES